MAGRTTSGAGRSLWRDRDFVLLWSAGTISFFGSYVTRTALPLAAIIVLAAGPLEISALRGLELVASLLVGLVAGAWVDRLRRRPIMIGADLGRTVLLGSIPLAALAGLLAMPQLLVVAFAAAILTTFFDVADRSYLPTVVAKDRLLEANSALTASASAAEFAGFGISGFLVQVLTAPIAIAIDAASFLVSAVLLGAIRRREPARPPTTARAPMLREVREGIGLVRTSPVLRALTAAHGSTHLSWGIFGTSYLLFAINDLGLPPAAIGVIAGLGGAASFLGAAVTGRLTRRFGIGRTLLAGLIGFTIGSALIPLAPSGAVLLGAAFLIGQQLIGDASATVYDVVQVSVIQSTVSGRLLGRVNATIRTFAVLLQLAGTVLGAVIAETLGVRAGLAVGVLGGVAAIAFAWFSPIRTMRATQLAAEPPTGDAEARVAGQPAFGGDPPFTE
ncbi:MAG TPA: MFS transporter [Candidatus Eisenbacteria bacterium]|nr:MFS transporter [Candidatus Eisenbacteria bacterium]